MLDPSKTYGFDRMMPQNWMKEINSDLYHNLHVVKSPQCHCGSTSEDNNNNNNNNNFIYSPISIKMFSRLHRVYHNYNVKKNTYSYIIKK